jgi:hypothetical protein
VAVSDLAAALDLDAQADGYEERRQADLAWHLDVARELARTALAIVRDESRNEDERLGWAASALETIAGHRTAAAA